MKKVENKNSENSSSDEESDNDGPIFAPVPKKASTVTTNQANIDEKFKINWLFTSLYMATLILGVFHTAFSISGNVLTTPIFAAKLGWTEEETRINNTMISSAGIIGLAFGSFLGGKLIMSGRRRASILMNIVAIIGSLICMYLNTYTLSLGRFINGLVSGVMNTIIGKSVNECYEGDLASRLSMFTNIGICVGITLAMNLNFLLPPNDADIETLAKDEGWRFIYLMPAFLGFLEIILYLTVVREEPIAYSIMNYKDAAAIRMMRKIFKIEAESDEERDELLKRRIG